MASKNDYNYLHTKCLSYFNIANKELDIKKKVTDEVQKARMGFYFLILENVTGNSDFNELLSKITDSDFNGYMGEGKHDDFGIDAIDINNKDNIIRLFSFKYRKQHNTDKQSINEALVSEKYFNLLEARDTQSAKGKLKNFTRTIIAERDTKKEWSYEFYFVSNDGEELSCEVHLNNFIQKHDLKFEAIALPKLKSMFSIRPTPINAEVNLKNDAIMTYCENKNSTDKNFIVRMTCSELIRITSSNEALRMNSQLEDYTSLHGAVLDYGVLFDNVRGFVTKSKYNPNIASSLQDTPSKFFLFNNGITIVAKKVTTKEINGRTGTKINIDGFQILNGGQTLRTIHKYNKDDKTHIDNGLSEAQVLVRVFMVTEDSKSLTNDIAEYTNSQNKIQPADLKSLRCEQLLIEQILEDNQIVYARKTGDTGLDKSKVYDTKISMETLGQILYSIDGSPDKATSDKQKIFNEHYDDLFSTKLKIKEIPDVVRQFDEVKRLYKCSEFKGVNIKYFYIMYLASMFAETDKTILIEELEFILSDFRVENEMSDVRKMGRSDFKETLTNHIKSLVTVAVTQTLECSAQS